MRTETILLWCIAVSYGSSAHGTEQRRPSSVTMFSYRLGLNASNKQAKYRQTQCPFCNPFVYCLFVFCGKPGGVKKGFFNKVFITKRGEDPMPDCPVIFVFTNQVPCRASAVRLLPSVYYSISPKINVLQHHGNPAPPSNTQRQLAPCHLTRSALCPISKGKNRWGM